MPSLLTIPEAADHLGVPVRSLRRAAETHGLLVCIGRAVRIDRDRLPELIAKCQSEPKAPAYTGTLPAESGSSEIAADQRLRQAQTTAQRLKAHSRPTSPTATAGTARATRSAS